MWRKILIGLVIAIPVAYGGIKLYAAHSIKKAADMVITWVAPIAEIRYQGTTSSLSGMAGITGVSVHTLKYNNFFRVGAIKLKSDNLFTLMNIASDLQEGEIPKTFGIDFEKVTIPITSEFIENSHGDLGLVHFLGYSDAWKHCGNRTGFSAADLKQMGITQALVDLDVEVQREPRHNEIGIKIKANTEGINSTSVDMRFAASNGAFRLRHMRSIPKLEAATMTFSDLSWHRRVQAFCLKRSGMTKKAWLTAHVSDMKKELARHGIGVGDNVLNAYRNFLKDSGTITLTISPQSPIEPSTLRLYSIQDAMYYLSPALSVNGKPVDNLDITSIKPVGQESENQPASTEVAVKDNYNYKVIPAGTLGRYIGKRVRLTTDSHNVFVGKLDAVSGRIATVDVKNYDETDEEIVLLTRVVKTEVATSLKHTKPAVH